jgi:hypothetical protein
MRSTTIVFRGIAQVVEAYTANDTAAWAIVNGNDILAADAPDTVDHGAKLLEEALRRLHAGNCRASFDLRVYKCKPGTDIDMTMKHHRAFRFALYGEEEYTPYEAGRKRALAEAEGRYLQLEQEIAELKKALAEKDSEEVEELDAMAGINKFFETPLGRMIQPRIAGLIERVIPFPAAPPRPAQVAGIGDQLSRMAEGPQSQTMQQPPPPAGPGPSLLDGEQLAKAQSAIAVLCSRDPKLGDHLEKLARIAVENPGQYSMLAGMLK